MIVKGYFPACPACFPAYCPSSHEFRLKGSMLVTGDVLLTTRKEILPPHAEKITLKNVQVTTRYH